MDFNPLPPHGGRLPFSNRRFTDSTFQSTPSAWRETHWHNGQSITRQFQSTPSAWRETVSLMDSARPSRDFNPLPPHGGRPVCMMLFTAKKRISIHSLRMEGDRRRCVHLFWIGNFNPLPPHGGRRQQFRRSQSMFHFNPLPPHGGRLTVPNVPGDMLRDFNPLPPHGGRLWLCLTHLR